MSTTPDEWYADSVAKDRPDLIPQAEPSSSQYSPLVRQSDDSALFKPSAPLAVPGDERPVRTVSIEEVLWMYRSVEEEAEQAHFVMEEFGHEFANVIYGRKISELIVNSAGMAYPWFIADGAVPKLLNENMREERLAKINPRDLLGDSAIMLQKMQGVMKLLSDDYEDEDVVEGLDLNARFADSHYAIKERDLDFMGHLYGFQNQKE